MKGLVEVCKTLPINDPDHDWTNPEVKSLWDAQGKLWAAVETDFKKAPESTFFFWLGYHTFSLAWAVPNLRGNKDRIAKAIESAGTNFAALSNSETYKNVYSRLNPDVVHAMQVVMSVGSEIADPMADMTDADVSRAVEAGEAIRTLAKQHKLLKG